MKKLFSILLISLSSLAMAKENLKIIVPFAAGGNTDVTARLYAKELANHNIDAVVVNRPGVEGRAAVTEFISTSPEKSLLFGGNGSIVYPSLESEEYYAGIKRLEPVMQAAVFGQILLTKKDSPIKTLDQLIQAAKTRTVSIGIGTSVAKSLVNDLFKSNPNIIPVPYSGDNPTILALYSNTVDAAFATFLYGPKVVAGEFNGLAVSTDTGIFGIKTFKEQGINVHRDQWIGFFAPPGTDSTTVKRYYEILEKVRQTPEVQEAVRNQLHSMVARRQTPEEFSANIEKEYRRLLKLR